MRRILIVFLLVSMPLVAKDKPREWQTGHIVSYEQGVKVDPSDAYTTGKIDDNGNIETQTWNNGGWRHPVCSLVIDGGEYTYFSSRTLSAIFYHLPRFTENAEVTYAIEKDSLVVLDDRGKEFKLHIVKRRKN